MYKHTELVQWTRSKCQMCCYRRAVGWRTFPGDRLSWLWSTRSGRRNCGNEWGDILDRWGTIGRAWNLSRKYNKCSAAYSELDCGWGVVWTAAGLTLRKRKFRRMSCVSLALRLAPKDTGNSMAVSVIKTKSENHWRQLVPKCCPVTFQEGCVVTCKATTLSSTPLSFQQSGRTLDLLAV